MTWPVALLLAIVCLPVAAYSGAIGTMLALAAYDALAGAWRWCRRRP